MAETFEELEKEIENMFSKAGEDVVEFQDTIWPAVMRCETFFRKSNDIRALELQVELLMQMGNNIYRGAYLTDAYTVCKRILEIDPNKEAAKNTIEEHIIPFFSHTMTRDPDKLKELEEQYKKTGEFDFTPITRTEIESMLEEHFNEKKDKGYDYFLDDWGSSYKLETKNSDGDPDEWDGFVYSDKGTRY